MKPTNKILINVQRTISKILFVVLCTLPNLSLAVEQELDKETTLFNQTFSWQAMMGFSVFSTNNPLKDVKQEDMGGFLSLSLLIDLYYKGFFIQSNHRRSTGLTQGAELGYQLHVDDDWAIDVLTKNYIAGYDPEVLIENKGKNIPTIAGLKERQMGNGIALRYSYFTDSSILSVDFAALPLANQPNGWLLDFYYSDLVIYRNWDIYMGGGVTYYSNQVMDYYYGISEAEVTSAREYYNPNAGFKGSLEIYAQYPLSKSWSFNTGITQTYYSNVIGRSPIIDKQHITQFSLGAIYVF